MAIEVKTTMEHATVTADTTGFGGKGIEGSKGTRNVTSLQACFPGTPVVGYDGAGEGDTAPGGEVDKLDTSSPAAMKWWFFKNVVRGNVTDSVYGLSKYDLDFNSSGDATNPPPDLATQALQLDAKDGKPASGFVPNPTSPGEGSTSVSTKPEAPSAFTDKLSSDGQPTLSGQKITDVANLKTQAENMASRDAINPSKE